MKILFAAVVSLSALPLGYAHNFADTCAVS